MDRRTTLTIQSYDRVAVAYNQRNRTAYFWRRELQAFRRRLTGQRILEVGCGAGRDSTEMRKFGFDYLGIDASRGLLRVAKKYEPALTFRQMDLYKMKFPPRSFDGIWTMATLLHVPKRRLPKVLRSLQRLLVPGGVMAISIKEKQAVDEAMIRQEKYGGVDRYFAYYTKIDFSQMLRSAGLIIHETFRKKEQHNIWLSFIVEKTKHPRI